jgi:hypothetical protein
MVLERIFYTNGIWKVLITDCIRKDFLHGKKLEGFDNGWYWKGFSLQGQNLEGFGNGSYWKGLFYTDKIWKVLRTDCVWELF